MQDRFRFRYRVFDNDDRKMHDVIFLNYENNSVEWYNDNNKKRAAFIEEVPTLQCTGLKDHNNNLIYEGDIIVIPNQYPFYDYKNKEDMKQDLNSTEGEIKGESILNYIGIVEWIYSQWQYVYHCVNPKKLGISEGINQGLNDFGFDETENTCYEVIGNIYENPELLEVTNKIKENK